MGLKLCKYFVKWWGINIKMFSQKWFQPNVSIILNRFSPIYTEVRDQETRKELSRANFLISFPPFFVTKYGRIIIQHCHGWLSIGIGFLRHLSVRYDLIYCGTKVRSDILHSYDSQCYWVHIFAQKTKTNILRERNSTEGLVSVRFFLHQKTQ